jgi:hypothetical protein
VSPGRFVQLRPSAFEDAVEQHTLSLAEQGLLSRLLLLVDYRTARYDCTLDELAQRVGIHRHNLRPKLARLAECGLIERKFPQGHRGSVTVTSYLDLVHLSAPQVAKHALHKERFPAERTNGDSDPQVATRAGTSSESRGANRTRLSVSVEAAAEGEVAAVVDINKARTRVASQPKDATPSRAPDESFTARGSTPAPMGANSRPETTRAGRGSAGGGSEATPVHPRSRSERADAYLGGSSRRWLRDPRAMGAS